MKRVAFLSMLASLLAAGLVTGCAPGNGEVVKLESRDQFRQETARADRPTVVEYYKPGCPACVVYESVYRDLAKRWGDRITFVQVNCSDHKPLCLQQQVRAYPTTILYLNGRVRKRWVNEHNRSKYRDEFNAALRNARD
jgi:thiol-disulfide isomerase/thioredoxin